MEAEAINVVSGVTFPNRNFELEAGGILSGVVVSPNRSPLKDVQVTYYNSVSTQWERQFTPKDGTFTFSNLAPGPAELSIEPPLHSGLVTYQRKYWIGPGEGKNLGLVQLSPGALIRGVIKDTLGDPISGIEYTYDGDYELGRGATATNGSFEFRLPAGNYALNLSPEAGYTVTPVRIVVSGTDKTITLPDITAYDKSNAAMTSGNIQEHAARHGDFSIIAFASEQDFTSDRWNGVGPMAFGLPDQGEFEVFVPPGNNINLALLLYSENDYGQESITVVDMVSGISPPAAGVTLQHSKEGQTIQGAVKDRGEAVFNAEVVLIRTPEDTFVGSAMTDKDGKYALYNVQKGKYRVFVLYYDHPVVSGGNLTVRNSNVTIPDIDLSRGGAINSCLFLLLGGS
jgi:hypothetical protein